MDISINMSSDKDEKTLSTPSWNRETGSLHLVLHHFNPPYKGKLTKIKELLGNSANGCFKDKGMQTQAYKNGAKFLYYIFTLQNSPLSMLHNSSIYSPSIGNEGSNRSVSWHMEGQGSSHSLLDGENSKYFLIFEHKTWCMQVTLLQVVYTWVIYLWPTCIFKKFF